MYCVKCGVKLADSETRCPLCGTVVYHPELPHPEAEPPYPPFQGREYVPNPSSWRLVVTLGALLAAILCIVVNITTAGHVTWGGFAAGGIGLGYLLLLLPFLFERPMPEVLLPLDLAGLLGYLLYIDLKTGGRWFLSFAFPVVGILGLLVIAVVVLCRHLRRGRLFVASGMFFFLSGFMMLLELFQVITFGGEMFRWSLYPTGALGAIAIFLLLAALIRPLRDALHRKFFL